MAADLHKRQRPARLFFALWPDEALRRQIAAYQQPEGRVVTAANWHITLLFLGAVGSAQQQALEQEAAAVRVPPFSLQLDRLGCWRRAGIIWLAPSTAPQALLELHQRLKAIATAVGIAIETRPYRPHLTLARQAPAVPLQEITPIPWVASEFCLVESITDQRGARYVVRRRWPLQEASAAG